MTEENFILILRLIHIPAAMFWVGGTWAQALFMLPATWAHIDSNGPFFGHVMSGKRFPRALTIATLLTVITGFTLYAQLYAGTPWDWANPGPEVIFGIGGVLMLVAMVIGNVWVRESHLQINRVCRDWHDGKTDLTPAQIAERNRLLRVFTLSTRAMAFVQLLAVIAMASGRYV